MRQRIDVRALAMTDLARLSSSQKQHFDFVLGHHTVPLELVLDLIVAYGRIGSVIRLDERRGNRGGARQGEQLGSSGLLTGLCLLVDT